MKYLLIFIFCLSNSILFAQDTTYYDKKWKAVDNKQSSRYYKVLERDKIDNNKAVVTSYYSSSNNKHNCYFYSNYKEKIKTGKSQYWAETGELIGESYYEDGKINGKAVWWYLNGQVSSEQNFVKGVKQGDYILYYGDGTIKRKEYYEDDKMVEGQCFDRKGEEIDFFEYEVMPSYKGGVEKLLKYLKKEIKYPEKSRRQGIEGKVLVSYTVSAKGEIYDVYIIDSVSPEIDAEAMRVIQKMRKWKPGKVDGKAVNVKFKLPINFKLD